MGTSRLYIGNLYVRVTKDDLKDLCSHYGEVVNVKLIEGTGFGYVEMANPEEADYARRSLDGSIFKDRVLRVK